MSAEAYTSLYFVRHAESRFIEGQERERGLTEQGNLDAEKVAQLLHKEDMEVFAPVLILGLCIPFSVWLTCAGGLYSLRKIYVSVRCLVPT